MKKGFKKKARVIILRTAGTNCDQETKFAFEECGAEVECVHIKHLCMKKALLSEYHILVIPGGFTYGDDIGSGRILANELKAYLGEEIQQFIDKGGLVIGICNGFQVLVKSGILPGNKSKEDDMSYQQNVSLTVNDSNTFESRWTPLSIGGKSVWTEGLDGIVYYPVAHAEGKFVVNTDQTLQDLKDNGQVIFRYCNQKGGGAEYPDNPNGSVDNIAGICDVTGRILGLMPHPERHYTPYQHPFWTRQDIKKKYGDGAKIFQNGVKYVEQSLL